MIHQFEFNIGQADVVDRFLLEVAASPREVKELVLVSPFVELAGENGSAGHRVRSLVSAVKSAGGEAVLISENTPSRQNEFRRAMVLDKRLAGSLHLCKGLHAKCGWAVNRSGCHSFFLGSANLTDAGLHRNGEIVFGLTVKAALGESYQMLTQVQNVIGLIRSKSSDFQFINP
jgi:hypothetical protein